MFPKRDRTQAPASGNDANKPLRAWWAALTDPESWGPSTYALILANAAPIFGVLVLHWQVFPLVLLYWLENVIVGGFNILRLLFADPTRGRTWAAKLVAIPVFCFHYGFFCFGHGVVVFILFSDTKPGPTLSAGIFAALVASAIKRTRVGFALFAIFLSHAISFSMNYVRGGEYRGAQLKALMIQPYRRVIALHFAILLGTFPTLMLGSPVFALLVLIVVKTMIDIGVHGAERRKLEQVEKPVNT